MIQARLHIHMARRFRLAQTVGESSDLHQTAERVISPLFGCLSYDGKIA